MVYIETVRLGSTIRSAFELANKINEPMTGRFWSYQLTPFKLSELVAQYGAIMEQDALENRLIYGSYPDVVTHPESAEEIVSNLSQENLYKDALNFSDIIKTDWLGKLLKALAFQIGSQVSINELAGIVELDNKTVGKYISLLEQAFIIFRLPSLGKNLRNELKSSQKIYFYDVGIRNALLQDFRPISYRQDIGSIFENYVIAEYKKSGAKNLYFWRTAQGQEVDLVQEQYGKMLATEIKWNEKKAAKIPATFAGAYDLAKETYINRQNYIDEILG